MPPIVEEEDGNRSGRTRASDGHPEITHPGGDRDCQGTVHEEVRESLRAPRRKAGRQVTGGLRGRGDLSDVLRIGTTHQRAVENLPGDLMISSRCPGLVYPGPDTGPRGSRRSRRDGSWGNPDKAGPPACPGTGGKRLLQSCLVLSIPPMESRTLDP